MVVMTVTEASVMDALNNVKDPEINLPLPELGMIEGVDIDGGFVLVKVLLTTAGCPLKATISGDIEEEIGRASCRERV